MLEKPSPQEILQGRSFLYYLIYIYTLDFRFDQFTRWQDIGSTVMEFTVTASSV